VRANPELHSIVAGLNRHRAMVQAERVDQNWPTFLKCSEACAGVSFSNA
jgi:hypothetical protein